MLPRTEPASAGTETASSCRRTRPSKATPIRAPSIGRTMKDATASDCREAPLPRKICTRRSRNASWRQSPSGCWRERARPPNRLRMPRSPCARCPRSQRWSHRKNDSRSCRGMRNRKVEAFCFRKTAFSKTRPCDSPAERFHHRTSQPHNASIRDSWAGGCTQPPCDPTVARETGDARRTGRGKARHGR